MACCTQIKGYGDTECLEFGLRWPRFTFVRVACLYDGSMEPESLVCKERERALQRRIFPRNRKSGLLNWALLLSVIKPSRANGHGHSPPSSLFELMLLGWERGDWGGRGGPLGEAEVHTKELELFLVGLVQEG